MSYKLTWITDQLAAGHAPMSYDDLEWIRKQGITAIVNLCAEYCDLHELEEKSGFEVYYLPVFDECAPDMEALEKALAWLDEALYLKKKVLVHCRHGQGRTGTFISAYLLRRGLGNRKAEKQLKGTPARPTNFSQWRLLRQYGRKEGVLKAAEPRPAPEHADDLAPFLAAYRQLVADFDAQLKEQGRLSSCGVAESACCRQPFVIPLIECIHLSQAAGQDLTSRQRQEAIARATRFLDQLRELHHQAVEESDDDGFARRFEAHGLRCPLVVDKACVLASSRPLRCRCWPCSLERHWPDRVVQLKQLSAGVYQLLTGSRVDDVLSFTVADAVSGKFVQKYFQVMLHAVQENGKR